jgi:hypothetical protein
MHFGFMNVILLYSDCWHVLATHDPDWWVMIYLYLYYSSPSWITTHHMYLLCTSLHTTTLQTTFFKFCYFVLVTVLPLSRNCNQNYMIFICGVILTFYKYIYTLAVTTLKMATWVAKTCRWSLCSKITFMNPKCICWVFWLKFMCYEINCILNFRNVSPHVSVMRWVGYLAHIGGW